VNTDRIDIIARVIIILLFAFCIGMSLPFALMQGADLLITRVMTGFFAPFMIAYLSKDVLNTIVAGVLFVVIGALLTLYIGGMVTGIVSLHRKMALTFALLLASLWDILVLGACLLSHFD
jgi:hypothetical protein